MNRRPVGLLFLIMDALACLPGPAHACQCGTKPPADVALAQSQVVVAGVVTAVENVRVTLFPDSSSPLPAVVPRATLKVQKRWKGPAAAVVAIYATGNCGYRFEVGRAYLAFASSGNAAPAMLEASICLPTKPFIQAHEELALLGPAAPPE